MKRFHLNSQIVSPDTLPVQPGHKQKPSVCVRRNATWRYPIGQLALQFVQRTASWTKAKNDFETIFSAENTFGFSFGLACGTNIEPASEFPDGLGEVKPRSSSALEYIEISCSLSDIPHLAPPIRCQG